MELTTKLAQGLGHYHGKGLLEVLMDGGKGIYIAPTPDDHKWKRKKKKGPDHSQGRRM